MPDEHVTREYIDSRFDRLGRQIAEVDKKADRNHDDTKAQFDHVGARLGALEAQHPGHSDDEIIQIIDERLAAFARDVLPNIVKGAINEGLRMPLSKVDDYTKALEDLQGSLKPVVDFCHTATNLRRAILWIGGPLAVIGTLVGIVVTIGWLS